jgi:aminocarboxymuconate-semialdehyde decarboxylase
MTSRRNFLGAATGVAFCSCGLLNAAHAQGTTRQAVAVNGKRVKTIDVHAHCVFLDVLPLIDNNKSILVNTVRGGTEAPIDVATRFAAMDAQKVDMEVLSVNPFWYTRPRDVAAQIVKINNEKMAELCAAHPDRFAGFASLTLQHPDLAVVELEKAMKQQGLKGAAVGTNVDGMPFSDPKFHPVWAKAEELGAALFFHPQGVPELNKQLAGNGWLTNAVAYPTETSITLSKLIFEGTMDKFPRLTIIAAHGGGWLPHYADRQDHACLVNPGGCDPNIKLKKQPSEYLKQMFFDSLIFTPEALRHLAAQVGSGQIMMGSDYPYPWQLAPVDHIFATESLSDTEKANILGLTAAKVLKIPV